METKQRYAAFLRQAETFRTLVHTLYKNGNGLSQSEIARKTNVSRQRINQIINTNAALARGTVSKDIRQGKTRPAALFKCVDCGDKAKEYDHRDYTKRRKIEPVCSSCNKKRGRGKNAY